jgi:hypothetical protein
MILRNGSPAALSPIFNLIIRNSVSRTEINFNSI